MGFNSGGHSPPKKKNAPGFTLREGHELGRPPPNPGDPSGGHVWKGPDFFRKIGGGGPKTREPASFEAPLKYPTKHPWCDCTQLHHLHASHNQPPLSTPRFRCLSQLRKLNKFQSHFAFQASDKLWLVGWNCPTWRKLVGKHPPSSWVSPGSREGVAIGYHSTCSLEAKLKEEGSSGTFSTSGSVEKNNWSFQVHWFPHNDEFHRILGMPGNFPGNCEDDHLLGVHRHFRLLSPLQLRCLSSVSNFSTSCHCQQSQGCCQTSALNFHPLHMFTTYHGTWSHDLRTSPSSWTNSANTRWTSSSFSSFFVLNQQRLLERMILQPQRKKNKYFETWNLSAIYAIQHDIPIYVYMVYVSIYIYYVVCVRGYTKKSNFNTVSNSDKISTGQKFRNQTPQGSPGPLTHQELGLGPWNTVVGQWRKPEN